MIKREIRRIGFFWDEAIRSAILKSFILLFILSCSSQSVKQPLEPGKESIGPNEDKISQRTLELTLNSIKEKATDGSIVKRDAHPKHHGCVTGKFSISDNLPNEMKVGLFAKASTYDMWLRLSNGSATPQRDDIGDIRGAGIKLLGVKGSKVLEKEKNATTQDFLLINHPVLPVGDPQEYLDLFEASFQKKTFGYFFGWNPFQWKMGALSKVRAIRGKKIPNMLSIRYWSTTPYQLGDKAVKYSIKPCNAPNSNMPDTTDENYLRKEMSKQLQSGEACFDFMVQLQGDPKEYPVEDPSYEWNESVSPFVKVAEIKISSQKFDSEKQMNYCENLSFNPWHTLPEHKPLGGINRVRKVVYEGISAYRHEKNGVPEKEPEKLESFK